MTFDPEPVSVVRVVNRSPVRLLVAVIAVMACKPESGTTGAASAGGSAASLRAPAPLAPPPSASASISVAAARVAGSPSTAPCFDEGASDDWLPRASTVEAGLRGAAIDALIAKAIATESDSLLLIRDGNVVVERSFGQKPAPLETRSVTKSVTALAVLALVADGKLASLDDPLSRFFPEFASGEKSRITLRHVLTHSSGLAHGKTDADQLNAQADRLGYARSLPIEHSPGTRFSYSNEASQLLSGVVEQAAGMPLDAYVEERIFGPIGIRDARWTRDRAGTIQSYFGLRLTARDLARIGLLLLEEGRAGQSEVLPPRLVREAVGPSATSISYGLLFWRRSNLRQIGDAETQVPGLGRLAGRVLRSEEDYFAQVADLLGARARDRVAELHRGRLQLLEEEPDGAIGFYAVGGLGQRLVVYPRARLVAVRQHRRRPGDDDREKRVAWRAFFDDVEATAPELTR